MLAKHERHSLRLKGYDYSQTGAYFVTIACDQHRCLFGSIQDTQMQCNHLGKLIEQHWLSLPEHFPFIALDQYVVMPNHFHAILWLNPKHPHPNTETFGKPTKNSLPTIIRSFKAGVTRESRTQFANAELKIWQRNYWEKVIRDENELNHIRQYIQNNPLKWQLDKLYWAQ